MKRWLPEEGLNVFRTLVVPGCKPVARPVLQGRQSCPGGITWHIT